MALAVDNQISKFTFQVKNNLAFDIGSYSKESGWDISGEAIKTLIFDKELRSKMLENSASKIDLEGPKRVAAEIIKVASSPDF